MGRRRRIRNSEPISIRPPVNGSGITPVISIIKTALSTTARPIKLVYANRDDRSIIFKDEFDTLLSENPDRLEIVHRLDVDSSESGQHYGARGPELVGHLLDERLFFGAIQFGLLAGRSSAP